MLGHNVYWGEEWACRNTDRCSLVVRMRVVGMPEHVFCVPSVFARTMCECRRTKTVHRSTRSTRTRWLCATVGRDQGWQFNHVAHGACAAVQLVQARRVLVHCPQHGAICRMVGSSSVSNPPRHDTTNAPTVSVCGRMARGLGGQDAGARDRGSSCAQSCAQIWIGGLTSCAWMRHQFSRFLFRVHFRCCSRLWPSCASVIIVASPAPVPG